MIDGKWDEEDFKSTFILNDREEIDLSRGYTREIFEQFLKTQAVLTIPEIAERLDKTEGFVGANLELLKEILSNSSLELITDGINYTLGEKRYNGINFSEPPIKSQFVRVNTIPKEEKMEPFGEFSDESTTFEFSKSQKIISFHKRPALGRFFDVLQKSNSTHISFEYIYDRYNEITLKSVNPPITIENTIAQLNKFLRRNGVNNIHFHCYLKDQLVVVEHLNNFEG